MKKSIMYVIAGAILVGTLFYMKGAVDKFENNSNPGTFEVGVEGSKKSEDTKEDTKEDMKEDMKEEYNEIANFTLKNLAGEDVSLSDYQGKKIFLNFWATWCPNCREEMPHMEELSKNFKDDIVVIAVNVGEDKESVQKYVNNAGLTFEVLLDDTNEIAGKYGVTGFPTSVLLDENGNPIYGQSGRMSYEQMVEFIKGE